MALTRSFEGLVQRRVTGDPAFGLEMIAKTELPTVARA